MAREDSENSLQSSIHKALRAWQDTEGSSDSYLDELFLVRQRRQQHSGNSSAAALRLITNQVLLEGIEELAQKDKESAKILRARFMNDQTIVKVSMDMHLSVDQFNRLQKKAISALTDVLLEKDQHLLQAQIKELEGQLPPVAYTNLYGIDASLDKLAKLICQPDAPWLFAIVGLGGIGKTTLADAVIRRVIRELCFEKVIWLRAATPPSSQKGEQNSNAFEVIAQQLAGKLFMTTDSSINNLTRIRQMLKEIPHLIIIDNLENRADTHALFENLADWGNPSKILITSRSHPTTRAAVFTLSLTELPHSDAFNLIRHQADITGLPDLAIAPDQALKPILDVVGGNPFALKLVISLAKVLPLSAILSDLPRAHSQRIEEMYRHIYLKAWQTLSESARNLLLAMPVVANVGAKLDQLEAISGLPASELLDALQELTNRSLLETRGNVWEQRYGIHRLTESFLRTEIIHWPEDD